MRNGITHNITPEADPCLISAAIEFIGRRGPDEIDGNSLAATLWRFDPPDKRDPLMRKVIDLMIDWYFMEYDAAREEVRATGTQSDADEHSETLDQMGVMQIYHLHILDLKTA